MGLVICTKISSHVENYSSMVAHKFAICSTQKLNVLSVASLIARRCILLHWKSLMAPAQHSWITDVMWKNTFFSQRFNWEVLTLWQSFLSYFDKVCTAFSTSFQIKNKLHTLCYSMLMGIDQCGWWGWIGFLFFYLYWCQSFFASLFDVFWTCHCHITWVLWYV